MYTSCGESTHALLSISHGLLLLSVLRLIVLHGMQVVGVVCSSQGMFVTMLLEHCVVVADCKTGETLTPYFAIKYATALAWQPSDHNLAVLAQSLDSDPDTWYMSLVEFTSSGSSAVDGTQV